MSVKDESCLDIYTTELYGQLATFGCHGLGGNQFFAFAKNGQIITVEELCIGVSKSLVVLVQCDESDVSQFWKYDDTVNGNIIVVL